MKTRALLTFVLIFIFCLPLYPTLTGCGGSASSNAGASGSVSDVDDLDGDGIADNLDDDADGDGFASADDCDDLNASANPGLEDEPDDDLIDSNCDGVDGDISKGVWVSVSEGDDANDGSFENPFKTLAHAISVAKTLADGSKNVFVVTGTYAEDVLLDGDVNLFGGYSLLTSEGARSRNLSSQRAKLNGVDGDATTILPFHAGDQVIDYTLLVRDSDSSIDALVIEGDSAGVNVVLIDSSVTIQNSRLLDDAPTGPRDVSLNLAVMLSESGPESMNVLLQNNEFFLLGTGGLSTSSFNAGVLAWPLKFAEGTLNVTVQENQFSASGTADNLMVVYAADDDSNPTDDPTSDDHADVNLDVFKNEMNISGTYAATFPIVGGANLATTSSIVPSGDELYFLNRLRVRQNKILSDSATEGVIGTIAFFIREESEISNNLIELKGYSDRQFGVWGSFAPLSIINNTFYFDQADGGDGIAGFVYRTDEIETVSLNYHGLLPNTVANNLLSFNMTTTTSCEIYAYVEDVDAATDPFVNSASPDSFENNLFHINSNCGVQVLYRDELDTVGTTNEVLTVSDLAAKTGFRVDDPMSAGNNLFGEAGFADALTGDFSLLADSIAVDAGLDFSDITEDLDGTARPQGEGTDIGAFESF
ncbi:MAG: putative metal-binding motif-containing protein [Deltaproteobacteria bacterium]|nr:putative metal-binding motif-containing protein [Deltaproteobacteria bacterium]